MEREAKFPCPDPALWERIARAGTVAGYEPRPGGHERQVNVYYDAADASLGRRRYACRVRELEGRRILTLKGPHAPRKDLVVRYEMERELPPGLPAGPPPAELVLELLPAEIRDALAPLPPLSELLRSSTERRIFALARGEEKVAELCMDEVSFETGARRLPVYRELEIELAGGDEGELARMVRWIGEAWGLAPTQRSKLEVGLELSGRRWP